MGIEWENKGLHLSTFYLDLQIHLEKLFRVEFGRVQLRTFGKNVDFEEEHIEQGPCPLDSSVPQTCVGF